MINLEGKEVYPQQPFPAKVFVDEDQLVTTPDGQQFVFVIVNTPYAQLQVLVDVADARKVSSALHNATLKKSGLAVPESGLIIAGQ